MSYVFNSVRLIMCLVICGVDVLFGIGGVVGLVVDLVYDWVV